MSAARFDPDPPPGQAPVDLGREAGPESFELLLIEDDAGDARLVIDDLDEWLPGATVIHRHTLAEAVQDASESIDCILLDLGLPDAEGLDAVAQLRREVKTVPLVVLTGLDDEATGVAAVQAGAQDYLVKGQVLGGQLARAIRYAIGRRQTQATERELLLAEAQAHEAQRLERGLAPHPLILDSTVWVASCYRTGRSRALLGGDFFDLMESPDGCVHALVGDVCGQGPDEAAIGVNLRATWRGLTLSGAEQPHTLSTLQEVFEQERHLSGLFATLCTLRIDLAAASAETIIAGHPRPVLIGTDGARRLSQGLGASAIGIGNGDWSAERVALCPNWSLLLYTDGLIEARTGVGSERLGEAGLLEMINRRVRSDPGWRARPRELLDHLLENAERANGGSLSDDVAMLMFGVSEQSQRS